MTNTSPVSEFDQKRFITEIVANAGTGGISTDELQSALDQFIDMNIDAAAISLWNQGGIKFAWANGEMIWSVP